MQWQAYYIFQQHIVNIGLIFLSDKLSQTCVKGNVTDIK
jgi:hypothetical protein